MFGFALFGFVCWVLWCACGVLALGPLLCCFALFVWSWLWVMFGCWFGYLLIVWELSVLGVAVVAFVCCWFVGGCWFVVCGLRLFVALIVLLLRHGITFACVVYNL